MNTINWKNATPEQINFWNCVKDLIAWTTITPLFYHGITTASEFEIYAATKLYIALEFCVDGGALNAAPLQCQLYDENDLAVREVTNTVIRGADVAGIYLDNTIKVKNEYFSRITVNNGTFIKFNGYRLDI